MSASIEERIVDALGRVFSGLVAIDEADAIELREHLFASGLAIVPVENGLASSAPWTCERGIGCDRIFGHDDRHLANVFVKDGWQLPEDERHANAELIVKLRNAAAIKPRND